MGDFFIKGGNSLSGRVRVGGAKNAALPIGAAAILTGGAFIYNCPALRDVAATMDILKGLGCSCSLRSGVLNIEPYGLNSSYIPRQLCQKMRSSVTFSGALLGLTGRASLYCPGGCTIGKRPVDIHLMGLRAMGVKAEQQGDYIVCSGRPAGAVITLPYPSVGAGENLIMAAVLAKGTTVIKNSPREPEVVALCSFLTRAGAKIQGAGTKTLVIEGVKALNRCEYTLIGDRIEAGTYLCAGAITGGEVYVEGCNPLWLLPVIRLLRRMGCVVKLSGTTVYLEAPRRLTAPGFFRTAPYPCVPTDMQPQLTALCTRATGETIVRETVFENRLGHIPLLQAMGANITPLSQNSFSVKGVESLRGCCLSPTDLRAGAAMVIAALGAEGESCVKNTCYIKRGYENMAEKLQAIGGDITEGS